VDHIGVVSAVLRSIGYDATTKTLEAELNNGKVYRYYDVPVKVYEGLMAAESHGRYFNTYIRAQYRYERVT